MSCMNCNKETSGTNVFCEECLQAMEAYPVEKGTPIVIPPLSSPAVSKKQPSHRYASADDQMAAARRRTRRLARWLIFVSMLLMLAVFALVYILMFGVPDFIFGLAAPVFIA